MQVFVVVDLETGVAYAVKVCELIGPAYSLKNKILRFIKCSDCIHVIVSSRGTILMYRGYVPYPGKYSLHPRLHSLTYMQFVINLKLGIRRGAWEPNPYCTLRDVFCVVHA